MHNTRVLSQRTVVNQPGGRPMQQSRPSTATTQATSPTGVGATQRGMAEERRPPAGMQPSGLVAGRMDGGASRQSPSPTLLQGQSSRGTGKPNASKLAIADPRAASAGGGGLRPQYAGGPASGEESNMVAAFLKEAGLQQYTEVLLRAGFDDMETLLSIEDGDLRDLGVPVYAAAKLRRRLQEMNKIQEEPFYLDESHPVVCFLNSVGLGQYAETLLRHGFDEMETLLEMEDGDMNEVGLPRGHALKLRKKLREYSEGYAQPAPGPAQPPQKVSHRVRRGGVAHALRAMQPDDEAKSTVILSWERVNSIGTQAVADLMPRFIFELSPELMGLFPPQVREKYREWTADEGIAESERSVYESPGIKRIFGKIVNAVGQAVAGMHDLDHLIPQLRQLGARHAAYGVREHHFQIMGTALTRSLEVCLGDAFNYEAECAWTTTFGFVSAIMIEGLRVQQVGAPGLGDRKAFGNIREEDAMSQCSGSTMPTTPSEVGEDTVQGQHSGKSSGSTQAPPPGEEVAA